MTISTTLLNFMKYRNNGNLKKCECQGHTLKVKVTWALGAFFLCAWCCGYPRTVLSLL